MARATALSPRWEYRQHRPEETLLYRLVAEHLATFLEEAREHHDRGLPQYVEKELNAFLRCGIHAYGFSRARCRACGKDLLVPFSCKKRGICPSCCGRRMCGTAAHLTDHVVPDVPLRQWVLSVPYELRLLLARHPAALSAVGRIFVQEVFRFQTEQAKTRGLMHARCAAVLFPQRFGGSLNLNVHFHAALPDGVFLVNESHERATFHSLLPPSHVDLATLALNVDVRAVRWLKRSGLLLTGDKVDPFSQVRPDSSALDACLEGSLGIGEIVRLPSKASGQDNNDAQEEPLPQPTRWVRKAGHSRGFDVHAGVVVSAHDREGRERLLRYCACPPISLVRLSVLGNGRIAYALRKPWGRQTHRVMDPTAFMARIAALIPPPYHPLIRFHGLFAPHCSLRSKVVPQRAAGSERRHACCARHVRAEAASPDNRVAHREREPCKKEGAKRRSCTTSGAIVVCAEVKPSTDSKQPLENPCARTSGAPRHCAPAALRTGAGRIPWAELLKRTYDIDSLACVCGGRLRFISVILDPDVARGILKSLHLPSEPPPIARARSPDVRDALPDDWQLELSAVAPT